MKLKKFVLTSSAITAGALLAIAAPLSASAHISVDPSSTAAGSYTVLTFALPHGCDGSATTAMSVDIPEGILGVTPTVNPNWNVAAVAVPLTKPLDDGHGNLITTRTGKVVYTAKAPLADGLRDTFAVSMRLPDDAAGKTLSFPITQTCEQGSTEWNETQAEGAAEPEHPAPSIVVGAATPDAHSVGTTRAAEHASGSHEAAPSTHEDILARVLGVGGLVVGAVGTVLAATSRRRQGA